MYGCGGPQSFSPSSAGFRNLCSRWVVVPVPRQAASIRSACGVADDTSPFITTQVIKMTDRTAATEPKQTSKNEKTGDGGPQRHPLGASQQEKAEGLLRTVLHLPGTCLLPTIELRLEDLLRGVRRHLCAIEVPVTHVHLEGSGASWCLDRGSSDSRAFVSGDAVGFGPGVYVRLIDSRIFLFDPARVYRMISIWHFTLIRAAIHVFCTKCERR
jgi:hypothetical protein